MTSSSPRSKANQPKSKLAQVLQVIDEYLAAINDSNLDAVLAKWKSSEPVVLILPNGQALRGAGHIQVAMQQFLLDNHVGLVSKFIDVTPMGQHYLVFTQERLRFTIEQGTIDGLLYCTYVLQECNGQWLIVHLHYSECRDGEIQVSEVTPKTVQ